ncbi:MAG: AAA family ATPase [Betaproteobacteria bacterium]|nr:AAA family ATPase [Betaproteobacteria bacterium]
MSASVTTPLAIPIAGFRDVYAVAGVEKALSELTPTANESLRATYEKMLRMGGQRFTVKPSSMPDMTELADDLPNFAEVLEDIRKHLALCIDSSDAIEMPPMLLLGGPGIGKTHFVRRISELIGTGYGFVPMSSLTAGWILSGASSQWKNAKPGKVFDTFLNGDYANPVMVVDEIDKASAEGHYDPLGALYALLEGDTATRFVDEFVELPIDASGAVWFATANEAERIPEPILNRMNVYEIDAPDAEGAARIAQNIYAEIREAHDWGRRFPDAPDESVLEKLASLSPREMRRALQSAFGNAKLASRNELAPADIQDLGKSRKQRVGF